jgi:hypothetical protein
VYTNCSCKYTQKIPTAVLKIVWELGTNMFNIKKEIPISIKNGHTT